MSLTRREMLLASAAVIAVPRHGPFDDALFAAQGPTAPSGPFTLPPLPYPADALEPHIDAQTMTIHHDRHHAAYVTNLNATLANYNDLKSRSVEDLVRSLDTLPEAVRTAVRNQGGGHLNHAWFWPSLKKGGSALPSAEFGKAVDGAFGDFVKFKESLAVAATGVFGSGWAWLSVDKGGTLVIETTANQDNPLTRGNHPLLGIDVWEHAYYLKYQNRRNEYLAAWWNVVNWAEIEKRFHAAK